MEGKGQGCQEKGVEGKGKRGKRRGGEKVRTPPPLIPAYAPGANTDLSIHCCLQADTTGQWVSNEQQPTVPDPQEPASHCLFSRSFQYNEIYNAHISTAAVLLF